MALQNRSFRASINFFVAAGDNVAGPDVKGLRRLSTEKEHKRMSTNEPLVTSFLL